MPCVGVPPLISDVAMQVRVIRHLNLLRNHSCRRCSLAALGHCGAGDEHRIIPANDTPSFLQKLNGSVVRDSGAASACPSRPYARVGPGWRSPGSCAATGIGFFAGATPGTPLCRTSAAALLCAHWDGTIDDRYSRVSSGDQTWVTYHHPFSSSVDSPLN
jgi:hypothetical protein